MKPLLDDALREWGELLPKLTGLHEPLARLGDALWNCWEHKGKLLVAGNGGSAADAIHFAEEFVVRFAKNRRALAAIALTDPGVVTCAANDLGYDRVFERQIEALGNEGDVFIAMTTSGNSENLIRAIKLAKERKLTTVAFLGKDGGRTKGMCDIELLVPSAVTARIQEAHKLLYHTVCGWVEARLPSQGREG
jgi:D-sedoheptulose 7-phosphate isomerase